MRIRPAVPGDVADRVALSRAGVSYSMLTEELLRSTVVAPEARRLHLVADVDGRLVGEGIAELHGDDATVRLIVHPRERGKNIGTSLYRPLADHLAALVPRRVTAHAIGAEGVAFGAKHGFAAGRAIRVSRLDPRTLRPEPVPPGVRVLTLRTLPDLRAAHEVALTFTPDIPRSTPYVEQPYDDWVAARRRAVGLDLDCSFVAFDGDVPVALTLTGLVADRMVSLLTGTRPSHRRRRLARLVKTAALVAAAEKDVTSAITFNHGDNDPILAVNERFGYHLDTVLRELVRFSD